MIVLRIISMLLQYPATNTPIHFNKNGTKKKLKYKSFRTYKIRKSLQCQSSGMIFSLFDFNSLKEIEAKRKKYFGFTFEKKVMKAKGMEKRKKNKS